MEDQEFLEFVVKHLVDHPDDVNVNRTVDEMGVLLTLDVHADDMGKVIGRNGNTAKAVRTLLRVVGMKNNARVNLKINEPEGGSRAGGKPSNKPTEQAETKNDTNSNGNNSASSSVDDAMEELKADSE